MAISGQNHIQVGVENQATGSDSIFTAFSKTETNFNQLFSAASPYNTFTAGNGITTAQAGNAVTITNAGVLNVLAGTGVTVSNTDGNVTISASSDGAVGVTSVGVSSGTLTVANSPIIGAGIISVELPMMERSVTFNPGEYVAPTLTVDSYGRISGISNTASIGTVTSVAMQAEGEGISVTGSPITSDGTVFITNTGVTRLNAGAGISLSGITGEITVSSTLQAMGTVTRVDVTSNSLTVLNTPITQSGTITVEIPDDITLVGNLVAEKVTSNTTATITGNVIAGNLTTVGLVVATGNVVGGNITTDGQVVAVGNVSGGNIVTLNTVQGTTVTTSGSKSVNAWGTIGVGFIGATATYTDNSTIASGNVANAHIHTISRATIAAANFTVTSNRAASLYIAGSPIAGANITITHPYALQVASGVVHLDTSTTSSNAATGALVVVGGVGVGGNLNAGGNVYVIGSVVASTVIANLVIQSVGSNITAASNVQANATPLIKQLNIVKVSTSGANSVVLPTPVSGTSIKIVNTSSANVNVFPASGAKIDLLDIDAAYVMVANSRIEFCAATDTQWYTF